MRSTEDSADVAAHRNFSILTGWIYGGERKRGGGMQSVTLTLPNGTKRLYVRAEYSKRKPRARAGGRTTPKSHSGSTPKVIIAWAGRVSPVIFGAAGRLQGRERRSSEACAGKQSTSKSRLAGASRAVSVKSLLSGAGRVYNERGCEIRDTYAIARANGLETVLEAKRR